jgi:hypothetical protein
MKQNKYTTYLKQIEIRGMFKSSRYMNPYLLFNRINGVIPSKISFDDIDQKKLLRKFRKEFPQMKNNIITSLQYNHQRHTYSIYTSLMPIKNDIFLYMGDRYLEQVVLIYSPHYSLNEIRKYTKLILSCAPKDEFIPYINLVSTTNNNDLTLREFVIKNEPINLNHYYNDDFIPIHNIILNRLQEKKGKGIVLLHGMAGTGKTTYIRHIIRQLRKKVIYFPPNLAEIIGQPSFMSFLADMENCVLVIEDAENVIASRKSHANGAISNLLNLCDGLLSDCLGIQVICTFNTDLSNVDNALLRKGRLIAKYEFGPLEQKKTNNLVKKLYPNTEINKSMTLAEIYNLQNSDFNNGTERRKIGF